MRPPGKTRRRRERWYAKALAEEIVKPGIESVVRFHHFDQTNIRDKADELKPVLAQSSARIALSIAGVRYTLVQARSTCLVGRATVQNVGIAHQFFVRRTLGTGKLAPGRGGLIWVSWCRSKSARTLDELGYIQGKNLAVSYLPLGRATSTVPIVIAFSGDPTGVRRPHVYFASRVSSEFGARW